MRKELLFLDFDGVLCDSLQECFYSSFLAYKNWDRLQPPQELLKFKQNLEEDSYFLKFKAMRPYVRSGEDYLVVHRLLEFPEKIENQEQFDAYEKKLGPELVGQYKDEIYKVRDILLEQHPQAWLSWNPLYKGIKEILSQLAFMPRAYILSTKKAEFISSILGFHRVDWPESRIIYTGKEKKLDLIQQRSAGNESLLLDDQIEHLDFMKPGIQCYLALWGYLKPQMTYSKEVASLTLEQALVLLKTFI